MYFVILLLCSPASTKKEKSLRKSSGAKGTPCIYLGEQPTALSELWVSMIDDVRSRAGRGR